MLYIYIYMCVCVCVYLKLVQLYKSTILQLKKLAVKSVFVFLDVGVSLSMCVLLSDCVCLCGSLWVSLSLSVWCFSVCVYL